jgi:maltose alpha-D-glucosyltransferase/alpha-amylase
MSNAPWYKHAVFYELFLRAFHDGDGDGNGDFKGLLEKLDYLAWLGIGCIWLLPFYASPMRDGGYDVSDFYEVNPIYGTLADLHKVLDEAHRLGIRVIADLVLNHTSDQHEWFQASRRDPSGPYGDWYVWSDTDTAFPEARVIFTDAEKSNWAWDPVRGQYYWHRFYSHQPDLNYSCEAVQEEMLKVASFWLSQGLDGFRLDAVPYLYVREGTNGENLPETHAFLKRLKQRVRSINPEAVLLAEANQWPSDTVEYFAKGDECDMCFHFPLMPRLFMAVRRQNRLPIEEILAQTPEIPPQCQWALFLRNHDELTLEMVTNEERDFMWQEYAKDPKIRRHMGLARRLAPLLDNDRRVAELLYALLFSLPGSPFIYYGDEIMMGDNVDLPDRDTVRTPMHWSADRNAGFSSADEDSLYLRPLMGPIWGYHACNVDGQARDPSSFLNWIRHLIEVRSRHQVFGGGRFALLSCPNPSVFAFLRQDESECLLCAYNLSRFPQAAQVEVRQDIAGLCAVDVFGSSTFGKLEPEGFRLTFSPYGFYWLSLRSEDGGGQPPGS